MKFLKNLNHYNHIVHWKLRIWIHHYLTLENNSKHVSYWFFFSKYSYVNYFKFSLSTQTIEWHKLYYTCIQLWRYVMYCMYCIKFGIIENVIKRKFNVLTFNMELISLVKKDFVRVDSGIFICASHSWKYLPILSHSWNKFHIQRQTIEYPLYIPDINYIIW